MSEGSGGRTRTDNLAVNRGAAGLAVRLGPPGSTGIRIVDPTIRWAPLKFAKVGPGCFYKTSVEGPGDVGSLFTIKASALRAAQGPRGRVGGHWRPEPNGVTRSFKTVCIDAA